MKAIAIATLLYLASLGVVAMLLSLAISPTHDSAPTIQQTTNSIEVYKTSHTQTDYTETYPVYVQFFFWVVGGGLAMVYFLQFYAFILRKHRNQEISRGEEKAITATITGTLTCVATLLGTNTLSTLRTPHYSQIESSDGMDANVLETNQSPPVSTFDFDSFIQQLPKGQETTNELPAIEESTYETMPYRPLPPEVGIQPRIQVPAPAPEPAPSTYDIYHPDDAPKFRPFVPPDHMNSVGP